jgi:hypothetical protein
MAWWRPPLLWVVVVLLFALAEAQRPARVIPQPRRPNVNVRLDVADKGWCGRMGP